MNNTKLTSIVGFPSHDEAIKNQKKVLWDQLGKISLRDAISLWLGTLKNLTQENYSYGMNRLIDLGLIDPQMTLQAFSLVNQNVIVDKIKLIAEWSEGTRQARAACFISFTGFLDRRTEGIIKKAMPSREGVNRTFFKIYDEVKSEAMNQSQWMAFLTELEIINYRDSLIAKTILQGAKRKSEVLGLRVDQINWRSKEISFKQKKTGGREQTTIITYPAEFIGQMLDYLDDRIDGLVFVTKTGSKVQPTQIQRTFYQAGKKAGIPFKISPHVLRATAITYLKQQGFSDSDIMKVSGHRDSEMIRMYDKSEKAENASKKVSLF
jgi:integrase/recombinase XerD